MKKSILLLLFVSIFLILGACGTNESDSPGTTNGDSSTSGSEDTNTEEPADSATEDGETDSAAEGGSDGEVTEEDPANGGQSGESSVTETVTLYFADEQLMETYRVEETVTAPSESDLPKATLQKWVEGPSADGLHSLVPENTEVQSVEEENGTAVVSFSSDLLEASLGSSGELFLTEQIAMIMQQFGYTQTKILVDGEVQESLFGHIDATQPVEAGSPEDYKQFKTK